MREPRAVATHHFLSVLSAWPRVSLGAPSVVSAAGERTARTLEMSERLCVDQPLLLFAPRGEAYVLKQVGPFDGDTETRQQLTVSRGAAWSYSLDSYDAGKGPSEQPSVDMQKTQRFQKLVFNVSLDVLHGVLNENAKWNANATVPVSIGLLSNSTTQYSVLEEFKADAAPFSAPRTFMLPVERIGKNSKAQTVDAHYRTDDVHGLGIKLSNASGIFELSCPGTAFVWLFPREGAVSSATHHVTALPVQQCLRHTSRGVRTMDLAGHHFICPEIKLVSSRSPIVAPADADGTATRFATDCGNGIVRLTLTGNLRYVLECRNVDVIFAGFESKQRLMAARFNHSMSADSYEKWLLWVCEEDISARFLAASNLHRLERARDAPTYLNDGLSLLGTDLPGDALQRLREEVNRDLGVHLAITASPSGADDEIEEGELQDAFESVVSVPAFVKAFSAPEHQTTKTKKNGYSLIPAHGELDFTRTGMVLWHGVPLTIRPYPGCTEGSHLVLFMPMTGSLADAIPLAALHRKPPRNPAVASRRPTPATYSKNVRDGVFSEIPYAVRPYVPPAPTQLDALFTTTDWHEVMERVNTEFGPPSSSTLHFQAAPPAPPLSPVVAAASAAAVAVVSTDDSGKAPPDMLTETQEALVFLAFDAPALDLLRRAMPPPNAKAPRERLINLEDFFTDTDFTTSGGSSSSRPIQSIFVENPLGDASSEGLDYDPTPADMELDAPVAYMAPFPQVSSPCLLGTPELDEPEPCAPPRRAVKRKPVEAAISLDNVVSKRPRKAKDDASERMRYQNVVEHKPRSRVSKSSNAIKTTSAGKASSAPRGSRPQSPPALSALAVRPPVADPRSPPPTAESEEQPLEPSGDSAFPHELFQDDNENNGDNSNNNKVSADQVEEIEHGSIFTPLASAAAMDIVFARAKRPSSGTQSKDVPINYIPHVLIRQLLPSGAAMKQMRPYSFPVNNGSVPAVMAPPMQPTGGLVPSFQDQPFAKGINGGNSVMMPLGDSFEFGVEPFY